MKPKNRASHMFSKPPVTHNRYGVPSTTVTYKQVYFFVFSSLNLTNSSRFVVIKDFQSTYISTRVFKEYEKSRSCVKDFCCCCCFCFCSFVFVFCKRDQRHTIFTFQCMVLRPKQHRQSLKYIHNLLYFFHL